MKQQCLDNLIEDLLTAETIVVRLLEHSNANRFQTPLIDEFDETVLLEYLQGAIQDAQSQLLKTQL